MENAPPPFDHQTLEAMNEKAISNQFFTPDKVYLDLGLFKDIPLGVIFSDTIVKKASEDAFKALQVTVLKAIPDYQKRVYDTITPYLDNTGYTDGKLTTLLRDTSRHDLVFATAPATHFLDMLIRHTIRNQNNSRPANKYTKTMIDKTQYVMEPIAVTYTINTFPLTLSPGLLEGLGKELGESLGVNIVFINKDPMTFSNTDWESWMKDIDCFYLDSLGRFTRGHFVFTKQGELAFMGRYFFARKRFEKCVMEDMLKEDFQQQIQMVTSQLDMMCDFSWLQNNDVRLSEEKEDVPVDTPDPTDETKT